MKKILLVLSLLGICSLIVYARLRPKFYINNLENTPENINAIKSNFEYLFLNKQDTDFKINTSTPAVTGLQTGNIQVMESGSQGSIIFRVGDNLYKVTATKIN